MILNEVKIVINIYFGYNSVEKKVLVFSLNGQKNKCDLIMTALITQQCYIYFVVIFRLFVIKVLIGI